MFSGFDVLDISGQIDNKLYHFVNFFTAVYWPPGSTALPMR